MILALKIFQMTTAFFLIVSVIMQSRGSQLGMSFGGVGETYRSKRGFEKLLYYATILFAVLFASSSILMLVLQ